MTTLDLPEFGLYGSRRAVAVRGRWSLTAGGTVEVRSRGRALAPLTWGPPPKSVLPRHVLPGRGRVTTFPLVSGALIIGDPVHLTVGEVAIAVDKTRSVRLTIAEVTALGNHRFAAELIVSALGDDAGPDEILRLEGYGDRTRSGALGIVLAGPAPTGLGGPGLRMRLSATFDR